MPESDSRQNDSGLYIEFPFGIVHAAKGEKRLLLADDAEAHRAARVKPLRAQSAQSFLKQALDYQARLSKDKRLNRAALAREVGITPTRLTQILHLLGLSPEVQRRVRALPPTSTRGLTEKHLRAVAKLSDHQQQLECFQKLIG